MIAALFVKEGGAYYNLEGVDPWPESRDARLYPGPHRVVAHPPCSRWCRLAGLVEARHGHKRHDDGGAFASALASVRRWGGVLEHPAWSDAWPHHGLPAPPSEGGWLLAPCGGWTCYVEQGRYGHRARKPTWLYAHGIKKPPPMRWGRGMTGSAVVGHCRNHRAASDIRPTVTKTERIATPTEFRDALLSIARSCQEKPRD